MKTPIPALGKCSGDSQTGLESFIFSARARAVERKGLAPEKVKAELFCSPEQSREGRHHPPGNALWRQVKNQRWAAHLLGAVYIA